jgi:copper homeostasis protein
MQRPPLLEVCAYNTISCIIAEKVGASRIELCAGASVGGTTPTAETIAEVKAKVSIPVYAMIRPRGGDFLYNSDEIVQMFRDIDTCKQLGCEGIATGVHLADGNIDTGLLAKLVERAYPMKVTCHRVFDRCPDPFKALEDIVAAGCERILTSGQEDTALEGMSLISQLIEAAAGRIVIMPGSGIRSGNIRALMENTAATEYHTSARLDDDIADEAELQKIIQLLNNA